MRSAWEGRRRPGVDVVSGFNQTKNILGVDTTVVHDRADVNGELTEDTHDWFARVGQVRGADGPRRERLPAPGLDPTALIARVGASRPLTSARRTQMVAVESRQEAMMFLLGRDRPPGGLPVDV